MSPLVLQLLPTDCPQVGTSSCPHWHIEKKMLLPESSRACFILPYLFSQFSLLLLQLSYLR
nr:hypothetical protein Iba_chr09cCG11210 [Ipomoea batatas]